MTDKTKTVSACLILGLLACTIGLYYQEITKINCRFCLFIYEMDLKHIGPFPILYGKPYPDYPSTPTILMYLFSRLLNVNMLSATLPSAIAAAGTFAITYLIGAKQSPRFGLCAALLLGLSYQFLVVARMPSPDMFIVFVGVASFYLVYTAELKRNYTGIIFLPFLALLGFSMRGPIGTVVPAAIVVAFYLTGRNFKMLFFTGAIFALMLVAGSVIWGWWAYATGGSELLREFFMSQLIGRFPGHAPFWEYFTAGIAAYSVTFPLSVIAMGVYFYILRKGYFQREAPESPARLRQALTVWIFLLMIGLSIPGKKHLRYIAVVIPATALMAAFIFENFDKIVLFDKIRKIFLIICQYLPLAILILLPIVWAILKAVGLEFIPPILLPAVLFLLLTLSIILLPKKFPSLRQNIAFLLFTSMVGLLIFKICIIEPSEEYLESSLRLVKATEKLRPPGVPVCFFGLGPDADELRYLIHVDRKRIFMPQFVPLKHPEELLQFPYKNLPIIVKTNKIKFIDDNVMVHLRKIYQGKLGHKKCTVFVSD